MESGSQVFHYGDGGGECANGDCDRGSCTGHRASDPSGPNHGPPGSLAGIPGTLILAIVAAIAHVALILGDAFH